MSYLLAFSESLAELVVDGDVVFFDEYGDLPFTNVEGNDGIQGGRAAVMSYTALGGDGFVGGERDELSVDDGMVVEGSGFFEGGPFGSVVKSFDDANGAIAKTA